MNKFKYPSSITLLVFALVFLACDRIRSITPVSVEIRDFKLDKDEEVMPDSKTRVVTYEGRGSVGVFPSTDTPILIFLTAKNSWQNAEQPISVLVRNGTGVIETSNFSADTREIEKPLTYEWKILGYVELEKANLKVAN